MNTAIETPFDPRKADRLALMLFLATAFHALVILGISFEAFDHEPPQQTTPTLDITVINSKNAEAPEEYDYLAESSQEGAGNTEEKIQPQQEYVEQIAAGAIPDSTPTPIQVLEQEVSQKKIEKTLQANPDQATQHTKASELINRSLEMLTLNEQINQSFKAYSKTPKSKHISARTKEFKYASYMRDWVSKVERVGKLNFPDAARRADLSGSLIVEVALDPDGSVRNIAILKPSGHKVLDDAAIRIVTLASPFAPFPEEIRKETDVLFITRTWVFTSGEQLRSQ